MSTMNVTKKGFIFFLMGMFMRMVVFVKFVVNAIVSMSLGKVEKASKDEKKEGFHVKKGKKART